MLQQQQINLLVQYRDKSFVYAVLTESSFEHFSFIKSLCNIPLILITSVLSIMNASPVDANNLKLPNIIINGSIALIMAMINNFKINEKEVGFKQLNIKMIRLCHSIEDKLNNNLETLDTVDISDVIKSYDNIVESNDFTFPAHIKKRITNIYKGKRTLPSVLNCVQTNFSNSVPQSPMAPIITTDFTNI